MKIFPLTFIEWNSATWRDELDAAVADYLARSGEEITLREAWILLASAMLQKDGTFMVVALTDDDHLVGYCVCRALPGTQVTGNTCQIWQTYVKPGAARLEDLFKLAWPVIEKWAKTFDAARYMMMTRRVGAGYKKVMAKIGFHQYATMYMRSANVH